MNKKYRFSEKEQVGHLSLYLADNKSLPTARTTDYTKQRNHENKHL